MMKRLFFNAFTDFYGIDTGVYQHLCRPDTFLKALSLRMIIFQAYFYKYGIIRPGDSAAGSESYILDLNKSMLGELGYEVIIAEGGEDAIRLFTENRDRIDLLILDMIMPDLSGKVVYDRIKSLRPDVRVILCSGYSVDGQAEKLLRKGCDGFLQKPYNMAQLGEKISEALK